MHSTYWTNYHHLLVLYPFFQNKILVSILYLEVNLSQILLISYLHEMNHHRRHYHLLHHRRHHHFQHRRHYYRFFWSVYLFLIFISSVYIMPFLCFFVSIFCWVLCSFYREIKLKMFIMARLQVNGSLEFQKKDSNSTALEHNMDKLKLNSSSNLSFIPYLPQPVICWLIKNIGILIVRLASAKPWHGAHIKFFFFVFFLIFWKYNF